MIRIILKTSAILLLSYPHSLNAIEVAFFSHTYNGRPIIYERGGRFYHVALRFRGRWLSARPYVGVSLTDSLRDMGKIELILRNPNVPEPSAAVLSSLLGKPFDFFSDWNDPEVFSCSKLFGILLGIDPRPMQIDPEIWGSEFDKYRGRPGLSPDDIYRELIRRDYRYVDPKSCWVHL